MRSEHVAPIVALSLVAGYAIRVVVEARREPVIIIEDRSATTEVDR